MAMLVLGGVLIEENGVNTRIALASLYLRNPPPPSVDLVGPTGFFRSGAVVGCRVQPAVGLLYDCAKGRGALQIKVCDFAGKFYSRTFCD